ncbi:MAG: DNA gyrase/topoisomerase IV subunit A [Flammeovirgaceae bacterium]
MDNEMGNHIDEEMQQSKPVSGMYENWFLSYASYVILERAVPSIEDGLKPVQRRIVHAMKEMDDGRFNKVANVIGSTMQYHPHGDASIGDAIVNLGQKDLLIETQGNWGDIRTGDSAAAPRYIEARLSKFANAVVFNPQTTEWQLSYDGRKKEPVNFPVKFPLLLAQGVEGIAVGLATKILPHNFCELIEASIAYLKGKSFSLVPDFPTGGIADFSNYNEGKKGGKVRVRARIEAANNKILLIKEIPYATTTSSLIDSIVKANDSGKIKIKKVTDNTAKEVEVEVQLAPGQSPDVTIDALYAFTDCEVSISPNACVIVDEKPVFVGVNEMLKHNTDTTVDLLKQELEIKKGELLEKLLYSSLEKIFIENRIYRKIEECETWEAVLATIDQGLDPYKKDFYREITEDDIVRLTEIKIKRISRFDTFKADELMRKLEEELVNVEHHLANLIDYAISFYSDLLKKFGKGRERKTEISTFDTIRAAKVAANNTKLYVNRKDGFIGYGLKKDEFVCDCSDIDDIIVFTQDGKYTVVKIKEKVFVAKNIIHVEVYHKNNERRVYNLVYLDAKTGVTRAKRFNILGVTRDKAFDLTKGAPGSKVLHFSSNPNGEAELLEVKLSNNSRARKKSFDYDFAELEVKGKSSQGNIVTKYPVRRVVMKREGVSTLGARKIWYDESVGKLNTDENGLFLGQFSTEDNILVLYKSGEYELTGQELTTRFDHKNIVYIGKFKQDEAISAIYENGDSGKYFLKRFQVETTTENKKFSFISEENGSKLHFATALKNPIIQITYKERGNKHEQEVIDVESIEQVKGWKSIGSNLKFKKLVKVDLIGSSNDSEEDIEKRKQTSLF